MPEPTYPNPLGPLNPIGDAAAAQLVSTETHVRFVDAVMVGQDTESNRNAAKAPSRGWRRSDGHNQRRRLPLLLASVVAAAAIVVLVPGLISSGGSTTEPASAQAAILRHITATLSNRRGTLVVEQTRTSIFSGSPLQRGLSLDLETITQTSASGGQERYFESSPGSTAQRLNIGNTLELYDQADDTIYVTTQRAWQAATLRQIRRRAPKGAQITSRSVHFTYPSVSPGKTSVFEQGLRQHLYKLAGQTTIDGHAALKLVPGAAYRRETGGSFNLVLGTVYVSPRTYYPIKEVVRFPELDATGDRTTSVTDWLLYKVLPVTHSDRWLVSLTARHPGARVVHSASGYLRASQSPSGR